MLGQKMLSGTLWSAVDRISMQVAQFAIGIVLGRILGPEVYTTIGILLVFIALSKVFIESGFPAALIQKIDRTDLDISTAFVFNMAISFVCYGLLFFAAPFIAEYYNRPELDSILRVLAISLVINALFVIPSTLLTIDLNFKSLARINFSATVIAGLIAIWMAYEGYGVWTLVWQTLIRSSIALVLFWFGTRWKLSLRFSMTSFRQLFKVGGNLLFSSLLNRSVNDASSLLVGKWFAEDALGLYSQGSKFSLFVSGSASAILNRVLLPSLAGIQEDLVQLKEKFRKVLRLTALLATPVFLLMLVASEPLIRFLLKDEWIEAVPIMQLFCLARLITIYCSLNLNILTVVGRTDLLLRQQYVAIAIRIVSVGLSIPFGIVYLALGELIATAIHLYINSFFPGRILNYKFFEQIKDIAPPFLIGALVSALCYPVLFIDLLDLYKILIIGIGGGLVYLILAFLFQRNEMNLLLSTFKRVLSKS